MRALQLVIQAAWDSLAAPTRAHTPLDGACDVVPLGTVHHGPAHKDMLCARDNRLPTMQVMRPWQSKVTRTVIPVPPCIFYGQPEEDTGHVRSTCKRDEVVVWLLCAKVEVFMADLLLAHGAMGLIF